MQEQAVPVSPPVGSPSEQQKQHREKLGGAAQDGPDDDDFLSVTDGGAALSASVGAVVDVHQVVHEVVVSEVGVGEGVIRKLDFGQNVHGVSVRDVRIGEDEGVRLDVLGFAAVGGQVVVVVDVIVVVNFSFGC